MGLPLYPGGEFFPDACTLCNVGYRVWIDYIDIL